MHPKIPFKILIFFLFKQYIFHLSPFFQLQMENIYLFDF